MSEMEAFVGKLRTTGKTVEEVMDGLEFPSCYDKSNPTDVVEYFMDKFCEEKILIDGVVFDVEKTSFDDGDIFNAERKKDGTIDFTVRYYNGGCSFSEAIELALEEENS